MSTFLTALGLAAAIEGMVYAIAPGAVARALARLAALPADRLRLVGLAVAAAGVMTIWLARHA